MTESRIEILDHTADLAVRIRARDDRELFTLGAQSVYRLIGEAVPSEAGPKPYRIGLQANGEEELFHDWLAEVLYWFQVREIAFESLTFETLSPTALKVTVLGRKIDVEKSEFRTEIKAVTYHGLAIERSSEGVTATVIFDV